VASAREPGWECVLENIDATLKRLQASVAKSLQHGQ
jgi:hypothetical protein